MLAGCYTTDAGRHAGVPRLSPAPSDRDQGRRAHGRAVHRQQPRRPHRRASAPTCSPSPAPGGGRRPAASSIERAGRHAQRDRRRQCACTRSARSLSAAGVPPHARRGAALSAGRSGQARHGAAQLSDHDGRGRALRPVAGRSRPDLRPRAQRERASTGISAARRSAISPPWSTTRPTWCSRAAKTPPYTGAPHHRARQVPPRRKHRRPSIPTPTKARSAKWANDHARKPRRAESTPRPPCRTSTSRRRRASRSRRSARPSRPPPPSRRPAKTAAWPRPTSRSRWAASPPRSRPTATRRRRTSS